MSPRFGRVTYCDNLEALEQSTLVQMGREIEIIKAVLHRLDPYNHFLRVFE